MFAPAMNRTLRRTVLALALGASAGLAQAAAVWHIDLDTSALSALGSGYLDLQFNPGNAASTVATSALVSGLSGVDAVPAALTNGVAQQGAAAYLFNNGSDYNDLFQAMHFGGKVSFDVSFSGLPDAAAMPGKSSFFVSLYDSTGMTALGNTDPAGSGSLLQLNWQPTADGAGIVSAQVTDTAIGSVSAVPEPSSWLMLGMGLGVLGLLRRRAVSQS